MPGDVNYDGKADMRDVGAAAIAFGSFPDHPRWNLAADENEDDKVNLLDIGLICKCFGKTYL
jgi:hypothetical protein